MEQQTEITTSSEQKQAKPADSFRSIITSSRYWLAALLPLPVILPVFIFLILRLDGFFSLPGGDSSDFTHSLMDFGFFLFLYISLFAAFVIGAGISGFVNFLLPFATTFRRALFMSIPTLIFTNSFLIFVFSDNHSNIIGWIFTFIFFGFPAPTMIMIYGWFGALLGIFRGRKA